MQENFFARARAHVHVCTHTFTLMIKSGILLLQNHKFVGVLGQRMPAQIGPWITAAPPLPLQAPPPRHKDNTLDNSVEITRHQFPGWYNSSYMEHASLTSSILTGLQISRFFVSLIYSVVSLSKKNGREWWKGLIQSCTFTQINLHSIPWENMHF